MYWFCHATTPYLGVCPAFYYSRMNAIFGCQNDKMKNWETNVNGYTTEEMAAAAAANA